ncbi:MAG: endonuclease III [Myxococcota bacterium]
MTSKAKALYFLDTICAEFPDAEIELDYDKKDPWQLLVAVALSAQTTDKAVNKVTPDLFEAYPDAKAFSQATPADIEPYIRTLGFFRMKSKNLVLAGKKIMTDFGGAVPKERDALESIPGVGPKSAAVILANAFGVQAIAVDTHVGRIARRLGLTAEKDPSKVETDLTKLFPKDRLLEAHHAFIFHGRRICHARKPNCPGCPVQKKCPKVGVDQSIKIR